MTKESTALIRPESALVEQSVHSKYVLEGKWKNPQTGRHETWTFNVNADIALPKFHSHSYEKGERNLHVTYTDASQLVGFDRFSGMIGGGKLHLRTGKGVIAQGNIVGGPDAAQSFAGSGTWLRFEGEPDTDGTADDQPGSLLGRLKRFFRRLFG